MKYSCPACNGEIILDDYSTATVFVCPHCNLSGNISKLKESGQSIDDSKLKPEKPAEQFEAPSPASGNQALEPITRTTDMAKEPQVQQEQPPPPAVPQDDEAASAGFLKEFEEDNIFTKVEENEAVSETIPQPPPTSQTEKMQPDAAQGDDIECPICKSVNQPDSAMDSGTFKCFSCGSMFSPDGVVPEIEEYHPTDDPLIGQKIGGCQVVNKVGEGGMGSVYKGIQISLDREVAIKILPGQYSRNRSFIQRFEREAKSLAKINHQNIMQIYDFGMHGDLYFMVMEFIDGLSLSDMIEERYVLTLEELFPIIKQGAMGLECAQKNGVIHRDVKPDNIMIDSGMTVKMTDFGLAKIVGSGISELTQEGVRVGTPAFMSPEQCKGEKTLDVRTDIYSLGCTFYFALTGKLPFTGDSPFSIMLKHQNQKAEPVKQIVSGIPDAISEIIERMMEKEPEDRYQTWDDFLDAIRAIERFMTVDLPDESIETSEDKLLKKETMDINVQKHSEDLPDGWGKDESTPEGLEDDTEKGDKISELMIKGDGEFSQNKFEDAINTWQKALFVDPNNIELQDKISEARSRLRQDKIELILAKANTLEKRGKYRKALQQLDEASKLKLSWQVKDMVSGSISRIQKKIRKRKMLFSIFRLFILFVCLIGAVVIGYPNYMLLFAQRTYKEAEKKEKDARELIDKDFVKYEQRAHEAIQAYERVIRYKVPDEGILGLVFKRMGTTNTFVDLAKNRKKDIQRTINNSKIKHVLTEAEEDLSKLDEEGRWIEAEREVEDLVKEVGDSPKYWYIVEELVKRIRKKSKEAKALYAKALAHDVFEMADEKNINKYSSYQEMQAALKNYGELTSKYPNTELGKKSKEGFTVATKPEGASVAVVTETGKRITVDGKTTPLEIPICKPNRLFTIIISKKGYKILKKKYRKNTLDKRNELFELTYGPCWVHSTPKQKALASFPSVYKDSLIFLAHNKVFSIKCETGEYSWDLNNYVQKNSPIVSRFYNNEEDIVLYKDNIIVPGLNGTISIIKMSKLKPGEWLLKNIDVRPSTRPTAPCILFPKMHQGLTGLFFGGGEKANMVGAVSIEKEKALWGNAGNDTPEGKDGEKKKNVLAQNIPGREVKGDVLNTPISMGNSILFSTTQGYIYDIDINTGTIRNHFKVGVGAKKNMIGVKGKNLYFIENSKDVCFIYKVNIDTGKKEWQKEISGNIYEGRPVILNGKIILGFSFSARGRVIAVSEEDGSIVWKYPKKGDISKVTQEIAVYNNMLFCAAGTEIIVLHPEKGTKLFEGYSTELANITEKLLVHDGYIYALTGDGKIYCFMIPASLQTKK